MKKRKGNQTVQDLEKTLRRRGGKIKTIYEKRNDAEINKMIEDKINYIWDYINRIDDVVNEDEIDVMENKLYFCDYIDKKKNENKFRSININDLYINYEMFKHIFLNIDLNIESNGQVW
ncbi:conserved Plasmodium protein, unknown function [Plasmodium ovale]|uniref:Uncharacterized protein n=1 Tax=Plasmodium ovale TaxID=36330 RepID=A0A1C3KS73_PLAOA|nr:conserved Plasmodium protein, unknown function [Plasmodium ovale]